MLQNQDTKVANLIVERESNWRFHLSENYLPPLSPDFHNSNEKSFFTETFVSWEKPKCLVSFCTTWLEKKQAG